MDLLSITPEKMRELRAYRNVIIFAVFFFIMGVVFYHHVEKLSWLDSAYFTVITLATVGYGDIVPHTNAGKIFTMFYVFVGIVLFVATARIVLEYAALRHMRKREQNPPTKKK